MEFVTLVL